MEEVIHQFDKYFVEFIYKIASQTYFKISHIVQEFFPFFHVHSGLSAPCVFFLNVCFTGFSFDHHRCFFHTPPKINMELPKLVLWVDVSPFPRGVFSGSICFHVSFLGVYSSRWLMDNDFGVCFFSSAPLQHGQRSTSWFVIKPSSRYQLGHLRFMWSFRNHCRQRILNCRMFAKEKTGLPFCCHYKIYRAGKYKTRCQSQQKMFWRGTLARQTVMN